MLISVATKRHLILGGAASPFVAHDPSTTHNLALRVLLGFSHRGNTPDLLIKVPNLVGDGLFSQGLVHRLSRVFVGVGSLEIVQRDLSFGAIQISDQACRGRLSL